MKRTMMVLALLALCSVAMGQEAGKWSVGLLGSDEMFAARLLYTPLERVEVGVELGWADGLNPDEREGITAAGVGLYQLVTDAPLTIPIGNWQVPVTWYAGLKLGATWYHDDANADARAWGLTGLRFGDDRAQLGLEYAGGIGPDMWSVLAPADDRVMGTLTYRF